MDPSKEDNFEDQWRELFRDASETPPDSVWAKLEAHLDEQEDKIVPLIWWRSPKIWLAAASVAAVLLTGGLFMSRQNDLTTESLSVTSETKAQDETVAKPEVQVSAGTEILTGVNEDKQLATRKENPSGTEFTTPGSVETSGVKSLVEQRSARTASTANEQNIPGNGFIKAGETADRILAASVVNEEVAENTVSGFMAKSAGLNDGVLALLPKGLTELDVYVQKRYVFFKPGETKQEPAAVKSNREYWAAVSFMPSTFNPDLKLNSAPQAFSSSAYANAKSTSGTSKSGTSYAYQTMGGVKVSKHWSVELGLSYLQGNSTYEGGGYLLSSVYSGSAANVLESAYADLTSKNSQASPSNGITNGLSNAYIDVSKEIQNNYRYLQLPLQAGYTLNPDGKFSYGVVGGVMTNFFLRNELESANGNTITTTSEDDVYKSVNLAATTGLRLSYRFSPKWKANLTGSYQKALNSTLKPNQSLDSHPYLYGVSWGVRYTF